MAAGCQEPFDVDRKDLGPFRIAAVGVEDGVAHAAIWSGLGAYHDDAPLLSWSLDGAPLGEGFDVAVPESGRLQLAVTAPDGGVHLAEVDIAPALPAPTLSRQAVAVGDDLSLQARRDAPASDVDTAVPTGQAARLSLSFDEGTDNSGWTTRWMSALGQGSLLEVEQFSADVLADEVLFEDGVVAERTPGDDGVYTQLALVFDGTGGNRWTWVDAAFGDDPGLRRHEGRLLALPEAPTSGMVAVTLERSDDLWGLQPVDPVEVEDLSAQDALACAPSGQPFRLSWVVEGRCTRPEVEGAVVVLDLW